MDTAVVMPAQSAKSRKAAKPATSSSPRQLPAQVTLWDDAPAASAAAGAATKPRAASRATPVATRPAEHKRKSA
jgi:hypothetical protein